jgi:transcriptional accessory protein Tex/SPT6
VSDKVTDLVTRRLGIVEPFSGRWPKPVSTNHAACLIIALIRCTADTPVRHSRAVFRLGADLLDLVTRRWHLGNAAKPSGGSSTGAGAVTDILRELEKPGRDPRPAYKTANFREGVEKLEDLKPGMVLEGVVTNVAAFGAFVDVGVHQDGLVHISAMANAYVKDPRKVAKPGDVVRVKVLGVEPKRRRISLTMRLEESLGTRPMVARTEFGPTGSEKRLRPAETRAGRSNSVPASADAMAEAFRRAGLSGKTPRRQ